MILNFDKNKKINLAQLLDELKEKRSQLINK